METPNSIVATVTAESCIGARARLIVVKHDEIFLYKLVAKTNKPEIFLKMEYMSQAICDLKYTRGMNCEMRYALNSHPPAQSQTHSCHG